MKQALTETEANERPMPEVDAVCTGIYEMHSEDIPKKELGRSWLDSQRASTATAQTTASDIV